MTPNPSRAGTQIQYAVSRAGRMRLDVFDVSGRVVATLVDRVQEPGRYGVEWNRDGLSGRLTHGIYFLRLVTLDHVTVRKLAIIQ